MKFTLNLAVMSLVMGLTLNVFGAENGTDEAVALFNDGVSAFNDQNYQEAVDAFRKANSINPSWKLRFNIGQCEAALKRYGLAIEEFELYLGEGGDEIPQERQDEVLAELDRMRRMVGYIRVRGEAGVDVFVDSINRGRTPMNKTILVTAGVKHWIWLVKDGSKILTAHESISGGETMELSVPGTTEAAAPSALPALPFEPTVEIESEEPIEDPVEDPIEDAAPAEKKRGISPILFWVGAGATVVFGGVTLGMGIATNSKWEEAEKETRDYENHPWNTPEPNIQSIRDTGRTFQILGYVAMGLTGAALIATVVAIPLTNWSGDETSEDLALSLLPWVGNHESGGLAMSGRF
ncbi:MAG: tetratricopeptide repeat protein [Proteobacteria bacterium]|nr:tetratricopeptide repeat protein [Pseudomonadota bacterium]